MSIVLDSLSPQSSVNENRSKLDQVKRRLDGTKHSLQQMRGLLKDEYENYKRVILKKKVKDYETTLKSVEKKLDRESLLLRERSNQQLEKNVAVS